MQCMFPVTQASEPKLGEDAEAKAHNVHTSHDLPSIECMFSGDRASIGPEASPGCRGQGS